LSRFQRLPAILRKPWLVLLGLLILVVAIVLSFALRLNLEYRQGETAWLNWKAERIAKGDHFEWKELAPPELPDEQNFAMAPI